MNSTNLSFYDIVRVTIDATLCCCLTCLLKDKNMLYRVLPSQKVLPLLELMIIFWVNSFGTMHIFAQSVQGGSFFTVKTYSLPRQHETPYGVCCGNEIL